ncbi:FUSC family protein [Rubrobacter aplysinae]|uniref:FUSC family protein n=1 Tax=Rubrobacter aplysinae TaxID=909625 RepID=UPI00069F3FB9|nr:FUSC family protein [Rubrobacter aplysinae]
MSERPVSRKLSGFFREGIHRLQSNSWSVLQTAAAASLAYFLARVLLGHEAPFFAPIAAVISISITHGRRGRRVLEVAFGVAVGLAVADLLVIFIGTGAAQIAVVVLLAMTAALFFVGRALVVNQAAISALLVVVLQPPEVGFSPDRFLDALVGGGVALAISYALPVNPERLVGRAAGPIFRELVDILEEISAALSGGDRERAERALLRARRLDDSEVQQFAETISAGQETARLSPSRRRALKHLELYAVVGSRLDLAIINTRVLARGAANAVRSVGSVPEPLPGAVRELARAVAELETYLEESHDPGEARSHALRAAGEATRLLQERHDLASSTLVGQIRAAAVDLLRSTGLDQSEALDLLEETAGRASEL